MRARSTEGDVAHLLAEVGHVTFCGKAVLGGLWLKNIPQPPMMVVMTDGGKPTLVSLCTGYGGLERGLAMAGVDYRLTHVADPDPKVTKLLNHWHPGVPNLGDITRDDLDWAAVGHTDIITAGYPCQPLSTAGRRKGDQDKRWIWPDVHDAIRVLRPSVVLLENVRGHLSLGFGRVLGDLAEIGFDARWVCLCASDVGAPHRRERVFIHAWPAEINRPSWADLGGPAEPSPGDDGALVPTPTARLGLCGGMTPEKARVRADNNCNGGSNLDEWVALLPDPDDPDRWGKWTPAIRRWEMLHGPVPEPLADRRGRGRPVSARFVEWLMGLPEGYVTAVEGLSRRPQLQILGNGVVSQQAAHAAEMLGIAHTLQAAAKAGHRTV